MYTSCVQNTVEPPVATTTHKQPPLQLQFTKGNMQFTKGNISQLAVTKIDLYETFGRFKPKSGKIS